MDYSPDEPMKTNKFMKKKPKELSSPKEIFESKIPFDLESPFDDDFNDIPLNINWSKKRRSSSTYFDHNEFDKTIKDYGDSQKS